MRRAGVARPSRLSHRSLLTLVSGACVPEAAGVRPGTIGALQHGAAKRHVSLPAPDAGVPVAFLVSGAPGEDQSREQRQRSVCCGALTYLGTGGPVCESGRA